MSGSRRRFSREFKDELCQEVVTTSRTIKDVAVAYGVGTETLRTLLHKYRQAHGGTETEVTLDERARLKEVERYNAELRAETAFRKKQRLTSRGSSDSELIRVHRLLPKRPRQHRQGSRNLVEHGAVRLVYPSIEVPTRGRDLHPDTRGPDQLFSAMRAPAEWANAAC